ncbi:unnamed protein product [Fusarium equiseti]|uniref:Uncharacterized protein n=1 Tax=Fusarium equiseti TaxID=61235 RepID=A0A8J2N8Z3_FUSEQ|nr:unnamed protein product [Fusarium equiseti]
MTLNGYPMVGASNDAAASALCPNDQQTNLLAAKIASVAAEKAKKEAEARAAAQFKAKAERDSLDLEECRAELIRLKAQLQEAQDAAKDSISASATAKSTIDSLQKDVAALRTSRDELKSQLSQCISERDGRANELANMTRDRDHFSSELDRRTAELKEKTFDHLAVLMERDSVLDALKERDSDLKDRDLQLDGGGVTVRRIVWGPRDLTNDNNISQKVEHYVNNGWNIPFTNDFFGGDPDYGNRKYGSIIFCKSRRIEGWENENHSVA